MKERYLELRTKILEEGTVGLTDYELHELVFLEEDLKEEIAQQKLLLLLA